MFGESNKTPVDHLMIRYDLEATLTDIEYYLDEIGKMIDEVRELADKLEH